MKVRAPDLYQPKLNPALGYTPERAAFLRDNIGIDIAVLAEQMGVSVRWAISFQRRLGLRKMRPSSTRLRNLEDRNGL